MSYWQGQTGSCYWAYFNGALTQEDWHAYLLQCEAVANCGDPEAALLAISYEGTGPSAEQRVALGQLIRQHHEGFKRMRGFAFATDSTIARASLTAINWVVRKPFPEKVFGRPTAAVEWLASRSGGVNVDDVLADLEAAVPADRLWRL